MDISPPRSTRSLLPCESWRSMAARRSLYIIHCAGMPREESFTASTQELLPKLTRYVLRFGHITLLYRVVSAQAEAAQLGVVTSAPSD